MEQRYKMVLEIILRMCEEEMYINAGTLKLMCETALQERGAEDGKVRE
jgi:hypothetical protein